MTGVVSSRFHVLYSGANSIRVGLLMLCADAVVPTMNIVGPYGLMHYLATMRGYVYRSVVPVLHIEMSSPTSRAARTWL